MSMRNNRFLISSPIIMANELTYDDYKRRISIRDILMDAGYFFNRSDGTRYPTYSRRDNEGHNIKGDKFVITANGLCCFRPPEHRNYNIIGFIKAHPELFKDYTSGMNLDHLVNLVCCRLLNEPVIRNRKEDQPAIPTTVEHKDFNIRNFSLHTWKEADYESQKPFFQFFVPRGISRDTQRAFSGHFFITSKAGGSKSAVRSLSFPMRIPGMEKVVGLEMRGAPDKDGKTFKGMALNTNATQGMWIASPLLDITKASELKRAHNIYWFESAYDAMAFYQLKKDKSLLDKSVFVSTGGSPTMHQFKGMLALTKKADHHLCFDNDSAGRIFAINFAVARSGKDLTTHIATASDEKAGIAQEGQIVVTDSKSGERFALNMEPFDYGRLSSVLGIAKPDMKDYLDSLKDRNDLRTGNYHLLPKDSYSYQLYRENMVQETGEENRNDFAKAFTSALYRDVQAYQKAGGCTIFSPCHGKFKDYNDQLLQRPMLDIPLPDKKQMSSEDIVESSIDGTDGVYLEFFSAHEEEDWDAEREREEEQERKSSHRR